ncbi:hypothetical protein TNCV_5124951 [Trichonephila clavipes]|nr:hypothetical protein TNCV_5124951 [Trichonephila clavipes]
MQTNGFKTSSLYLTVVTVPSLRDMEMFAAIQRDAYSGLQTFAMVDFSDIGEQQKIANSWFSTYESTVRIAG